MSYSEGENFYGTWPLLVNPLVSANRGMEHVKGKYNGHTIGRMWQDRTSRHRPKENLIVYILRSAVAYQHVQRATGQFSENTLWGRENKICSTFRSVRWLISIIFFRCYYLHIEFQSTYIYIKA